jgi:hypothetical protein
MLYHRVHTRRADDMVKRSMRLTTAVSATALAAASVATTTGAS